MPKAKAVEILFRLDLMGSLEKIVAVLSVH
jgi:hypothetical protein